MQSRSHVRPLLAIFGACAGLLPATAQAQDVAAFYKGRSISMFIASAVGGGYDAYARLVGRHIGKYIPGTPNVIVQNVPGGGSLRLANQIANVAPRDGSLFALASNGMPTTPLLMPEAAHFDPTKFAFVGSTSREIEIMVVWHEAPVKALDDIFVKEMIVGTSGPGSATRDFPIVMNALLGTKFKIVTGYIGAGAVKLAMQRGEVHSNVALAWGSAKTSYGDLLRDKKLNIVAKYSPTTDPELASVPIMPPGKTEADRQILDILYSREAYGRPFFTPPGVPAERVAALRRAFADTMKDPEFRSDAKQRRVEVEPITGEALDALTQQLVKIPADVVARARRLLAPGSAK